MVVVNKRFPSMHVWKIPLMLILYAACPKFDESPSSLPQEVAEILEVNDQLDEDHCFSDD